MAVYIVAIAIAIIGLAASYRAFGGGQSRPHDPLTTLSRCRDALLANVAALDAVITAGTTAPGTPPDGEQLRQGRRGAAAVQNHFDLLPTGPDVEPAIAAPAAVLACAAEDVAWAWKLVGVPGWPLNRGLAAAVGQLRDHASECAAEAARLRGAAPLGEPAEGA